jgi:two-component system phosphate regulon sensor histidine kinase PhoR
MRRRTVRIIVILALISIVGITVTQTYWVTTKYIQEKEDFEKKTETALRKVAQEVLKSNSNESKLQLTTVRQLAGDYYVVNVNDEINANVLEFYLKKEFFDANIRSSFSYSIYDCEGDRIVYSSGLNEHGEKIDIKPRVDLPVYKHDNYYFSVYFPNKKLDVASGIRAWIFSTVAVLVVLISFGIMVYIVLRQERLSAIQKDFINNMTHEFKTPIATISISSDVLKNPNIIKTPERLASYATIIQEEALRLKNQVERVLQMAHLDREDIKLKWEVVDAHEIIQKSIQNIQPSLNEKGAVINCTLAASNPNIMTDKLHLTNIIFNLLDNALKYARENPEVKIVTSNHGNNLVIDVIDRGIGISPEHRKKIFDKFYRVPTGNVHNVKGFGLGLNYVKIMMKNLKGSIDLESEPGKGSTFTLTFPSI